MHRAPGLARYACPAVPLVLAVRGWSSSRRARKAADGCGQMWPLGPGKKRLSRLVLGLPDSARSSTGCSTAGWQSHCATICSRWNCISRLSGGLSRERVVASMALSWRIGVSETIGRIGQFWPSSDLDILLLSSPSLFSSDFCNPSEGERTWETAGFCEGGPRSL